MNILITGGSSGLGKAIVTRLAATSENRIYFTYNKNAQAAQQLTERFANTTALKADFASEEELLALLKTIGEAQIDVVVNNVYAGEPQTTHFHKIPYQDFAESFNRNLIPTIRITQAAIEGFKSRKFGKIINILTDAILNLPPAGYAIYAANKAYLHELSKVWNKEYVRYNITSNCVAPAYMTTAFAAVDERIVEQMEATHPLKKLLSPDEVAQVVEFLVSCPQQVNGLLLPVNAGQNVL